MTLLPPQSGRPTPADATVTSGAPSRDRAIGGRVTPRRLAVLGAVAGLAALLADVQPGGSRVMADDPVEDAPFAHDLDMDGLHDDYEWVLRSDPDVADTDGDGYSDLEEFARGSSVFWNYSTPLPGDIATHMTARQGDGVVHVLMATYVADGYVDGYASSVGMQIGEQTVLVPPSYVAQHGSLETIPLASGGAVQLFELPIRDTIFHGLGFLCLFGTVADANTGTVIVADAIDIKSDTASLFLRTQIKDRPNSRSDLRTVNQSGGSVYVPLPPPGQLPSTWAAGQICRQVSTVIGVVDGVVTREITQAECVEALESYCKSDCAMSVGTVEQSVDPLSLIGG